MKNIGSKFIDVCGGGVRNKLYDSANSRIYKYSTVWETVVVHLRLPLQDIGLIINKLVP
jgi:hypothetical protein